MKLLWIGDGGCDTGFGIATNNICNRLVAKGWSIRNLAVNYRGLAYPKPLFFELDAAAARRANDLYGYTRVTELLETFKPDIVVVFNDLPIVYEYLRNDRLRDYPLVIYAPVDCENFPNFWVDSLRRCTMPILYSQFGMDEIKKYDPTIPTVLIYHGVDTDVFYPISESRPGVLNLDDGRRRGLVTSKQEIKATVKLEEKFIVLWVDRNAPRKNMPGFFYVINKLKERYGDQVIGWFHSRRRDEGGDVQYFAERYNLVEGLDWVGTPGLDSFLGLPDSDLNALYNMADVKLSTSTGEGFGLTNAEALATGLPVVASGFSATGEVVGPGGILVGTSYVHTTPRAADLHYPDLNALVDACAELYEQPDFRESLGEVGRSYVERMFNWDYCATRFDEELKRAYEQYHSRGKVSAPPLVPKAGTVPQRVFL